MVEPGFSGDIYKTFVIITANPLALVLTLIGTIESILLLASSGKSVFIFLKDNFAKLLLSVTVPFLKSILEALIKFCTYLFTYREVITVNFLLFVPFVLGERDFLTTSAVSLLFLLFPILSRLQITILAFVWIFYSAFRPVHKFILVLLCVLFVYLDLFQSLASGGSVEVWVVDGVKSLLK